MFRKLSILLCVGLPKRRWAHHLRKNRPEGVFQNCINVRYVESVKVTSTSSNYIAKPWNPSSFYSNSSNSFAFKRFSAPKALVLSSLALHLALNLHFFRFMIDYEICEMFIIYKLYNKFPSNQVKAASANQKAE